MDNSQALAGVWIGLQAVGLPAAVFAVAAAVLSRFAGGGLALGGAAALGALSGWAALFGPQAALPPRQTLDWLPWLALALLAVAAVTARRGAALRWAGRIGVLTLGLWLLSPPLLVEAAAATRLAEWGGALGLGLLLGWAVTRRHDGRRAAAALATAFGSLGFVTALSGSIVVGGLALAAFAVAGLVWLGQVTGRLSPAPAGLAAAGVTWWLWLAFSARHLAELPLPETLLAAAAAAVAALALDAARDGRAGRLLAQVLPAAAPAGVAVGLALWRYLSAAAMGY